MIRGEKKLLGARFHRSLEKRASREEGGRRYLNEHGRGWPHAKRVIAQSDVHLADVAPYSLGKSYSGQLHVETGIFLVHHFDLARISACDCTETRPSPVKVRREHQELGLEGSRFADDAGQQRANPAAGQPPRSPISVDDASGDVPRTEHPIRDFVCTHRLAWFLTEAEKLHQKKKEPRRSSRAVPCLF